MNNLYCDVHNCVNNKNELCARSSIKVAGESAGSEDATCCASFGKRGTSYENAVSTNMDPIPQTEILCDVKNCAYHNQNDRCTASSVNVSGSGASNSKETLCTTFKTK